MSHKNPPKDEPSKTLQEKLKKDPDDKDLQVDVGSDESMDASDPISAAQHADDSPHPNSNAPKSDEEE
ncbi:hypothetical protein WJT74_07065 [Sphingomicrobium sp. XHP0239]|uniref:hypothetical protein n=1 Tax=Sphingomicrobium maritimum TaxID=3133972 RepID=UPI0031CC7E93